MDGVGFGEEKNKERVKRQRRLRNEVYQQKETEKRVER